MKSTPIIMQGHNVLAIAEGRKTMTRRVIKPQPREDFSPTAGIYHPTKVARDGEEYPGDPIFGVWDGETAYPCRYGGPGNELWVKETYFYRANGATPLYRADGEFLMPGQKWHSPIFMPRWACRLVLTLTDVQVQRVQEISEADVFAEGFQRCIYRHGAEPHVQLCDDGTDALLPDGRVFPPVAAYHTLWESINCKGDGANCWDCNPFVWVLSFAVKENRVRTDAAKAAAGGAR